MDAVQDEKKVRSRVFFYYYYYFRCFKHLLSSIIRAAEHRGIWDFERNARSLIYRSARKYFTNALLRRAGQYLRVEVPGAVYAHENDTGDLRCFGIIKY